MMLERQFGASCDTPMSCRPHGNQGVNTAAMTHPLVKGGQTPQGHALLEGSWNRLSVLMELTIWAPISPALPSLSAGDGQAWGRLKWGPQAWSLASLRGGKAGLCLEGEPCVTGGPPSPRGPTRQLHPQGIRHF